MPVGHCRRISPLLSAQNCRIKTRPKQNRFPGHFRHSRLPSWSWSGALPPQAAWPGETHSAPSADSLLTRVGLTIRTLTHVRLTGPTRANERINKSVTLTGRAQSTPRRLLSSESRGAAIDPPRGTPLRSDTSEGSDPRAGGRKCACN